MTDYNIEVEISIDYVYDTYSEKGGELLARLLGADVQTTVYAQGRTFNSIDDYNDWAERNNQKGYSAKMDRWADKNISDINKLIDIEKDKIRIEIAKKKGDTQ